MIHLAESVRILAGGFFVLAALSKILQFRVMTTSLWLPGRLAGVNRKMFLGLLVGVELLIGIAVTFVISEPIIVGIPALFILLAFTIYGVLAVRAEGSCKCFGPARTVATTPRVVIVRNTILATATSLGLLGALKAPTFTTFGLALAVSAAWLAALTAWGLVVLLQRSTLGRNLLLAMRRRLRGRVAIF